MVKAFKGWDISERCEESALYDGLVADDKDGAMEYIYSNFGSRHGVKRRFVVVSSMSEIDPSESTDPRVISAFRK